MGMIFGKKSASSILDPAAHPLAADSQSSKIGPETTVRLSTEERSCSPILWTGRVATIPAETPSAAFVGGSDFVTPKESELARLEQMRAASMLGGGPKRIDQQHER